jgi:hypothetical protein
MQELIPAALIFQKKKKSFPHAKDALVFSSWEGCMSYGVTNEIYM